MKLIGMLDSPFVRRTAISLASLGFSFEHVSLSVFIDYERFKQVNPLVKAPTVLLDSGITLVDSALIIQWAEKKSQLSLYAEDPETFAFEQHVTGLASIANEKTIQIVYEYELRPEEKRHAPWLARVTEQLNETLNALENHLQTSGFAFNADALTHASIATAVAWYFNQHMRPGLNDANRYPNLVAWSEQAEATGVFKQYPFDTSMSTEGSFND